MPATTDEAEDYNGGQAMDKIKLRVFSVAKSDQPDLYSAVDPE